MMIMREEEEKNEEMKEEEKQRKRKKERKKKEKEKQKKKGGNRKERKRKEKGRVEGREVCRILCQGYIFEIVSMHCGIVKQNKKVSPTDIRLCEGGNLATRCVI